jgi:hypothetical protein
MPHHSRRKPATIVPLIIACAIGCGGDGTGPSEGGTRVAPVSVVALTLVRGQLSVGENTQADVVLRDAGGAIVTGRAIAWSSSSPSVATVSAEGLVAAVSPGIATILATSEGKSGSAVVSVRVKLAILQTDSLLEPGRPFTLKGSGLSSAIVTIAGIAAPVIEATDSAVSVTVPTSPWSACVAAQTTFSVTVLNSAGDNVTVSRAAAERPSVIDLSSGGYVDITSAVSKGCRITLAKQGTYLAVPYLPERPHEATATVADSVTVRVRMGDADSRTAIPVSLARSAFVIGGSAAPFERDVRDLIRSPSRISRGVGCALPDVGGAVKARTNRDTQGRVTALWEESGSATAPEDWTIFAAGKSIAVAIDSSTARIVMGDARWATALADIVAFSDTLLVPFLERSFHGLPDTDENGKLLVYVSGFSSLFNFAVNSNIRSDCPAASGSGEAIFLNWSQYFAGDPPNVSRRILAHEMAHIVDWGLPGHARGSWAREGFADLASILFMQRASANPLADNLSRFARNDGVGYACPVRPMDVRTGPYGLGWLYSTACNMVGYLFQRYQARFGGTIKDIYSTWSTLPNTETMEDAESFLQQPSGSVPAFGQWLLSLYADDYVLGAPAELQQTMWDLRQLWSNELSDAFGSYPFPEIRMTTTSPAVSFKLGAPDVRYLELVASSGTMLEVTRSGVMASDMRSMLLRVR